MEDHIYAADSLVEEREVVMHPPSGGNPTLRNAHFLKPIFSQDHTHFPTPPRSVLSSKPTSQNLKNWSLNSYKTNPSEKWKIWVHSLKPKYQEIWKQAGIYEAILASTYKIPRNKDLIFCLAERWCSETNTFVFPWGEVTITLEDVMFLGGYSVLGALFLTPLSDECVGVFDSLKKAFQEIKLAFGGHASSPSWMEYFMCSGKDLEHEAFLVMWLSRFVFPCCSNEIIIRDFDVAIHLSRGNRIALAPVVLASIYMDMRLLHKSIVKSIDLESKVGFLICRTDLVQMWAWERFPELRTTPSVMDRTEPRSARWNGVKTLDVKNVRTALDSAEESFVWRPYVITSSNCVLSKLYRDNERWVVVESDDTESLARCLRVSELVGIGYIEQYLPHRVAMQFGLDQDVPPHVVRSNDNPKTAWRSYNRSVRGMKLYIPPRLLESDVSSRYVIWWRSLLPVNEQVGTICSQKEKQLPLISRAHKRRPDDGLTIAKEKSPRKERSRKIKRSDQPRKIKKSRKSNANCPENYVLNIEEETYANTVTATCTLVEERYVTMYSPCGGNPTLRNAHFLRPIFSEHHNHLPSPPTSLFSSKNTSGNLKNYTLISSRGSPSEKWKKWVHSLKPKYQEIWKQAGIYEAILSSTHIIPKDKNLIMGLAERWCAETNTFVFPWGEVTITLEDVMFLGGYSVLGALFLTPLPDEGVGIFKSLKDAYKEVGLVYGGQVIASMWMEYFMCSGKDLEHEAFLAMWLSRFVLIRSNGTKIVIKDFHAAIYLSRGTRIALAPVVLASIYTNMRLLRNSISESIELDSEVHLRLILCHTDLVHMWVWERFPKLRPTPGVMEGAEPRSSRWNGVKIVKVRDVRATLDSGKESFIWRPYVVTSSNCMLSKLYRDSEQWVVVESDDTESFARCVRVSELVGLDCIEQYLPHRVAEQFGLDQDVPPVVKRTNGCRKTAWSSYNRSLRGTKLYIPPRISESDVSSRYVVWWRGLLAVNEETVTTCIQIEKRLPLISWGHKRRRSRKTLSKKSKSLGKRIDLDDMLVLKTQSGPQTPAKSFCMNDPVISSVRSMPSSDKSKERKSCAERSVNLNEDAVNNANHSEANNINIELTKDEIVSKAKCQKNEIITIEEDCCGNSTSELPHLVLMARILRLEKIVDVIKSAKLDASSSGH
ncbi:hypothetical protein POM88_048616 [Heracleum sosnowskyi]|uniref:Aminotransferase-like plant mobile domain-containing protein n=1 Tax=Heracleum sosnowskyi TaxID=360622 RepID=A0AAD8GWL7_9APIA|nr:hypothetical protein POM88_048616 [Heracleum sosnowskyi]